MKSDSAVPVRRAERMLCSQFDEGIIMMDVEKGLYYTLERTAARLWELTEHPTTIDALSTRLAAEYDIAPDACLEAVRAFVQQLSERGVLETGDVDA